MKLSLTRVLTACCLVGLAQPVALMISPATLAQPAGDLYYSFYGQAIPLTLRQDAVGVTFQEVSAGTRGGGSELPYLRLQRDLNTSGARGMGADNNIEVKPLGDRHAIVSLPADPQQRSPGLTNQIAQQPYVQETVPVLTGRDGAGTVLLPNEIVLNFDASLSEQQVQTLIKKQNLQIIRPLRFTQNRYLVRSLSSRGLAILGLSNRLSRLPGVTSASPNFVQTVSHRIESPPSGPSNALPYLKRSRSQSSQQSSPYASSLLSLQWHLDSSTQRQPSPRTDIRAIEAWGKSSGGRGVTVAVIDSIIQWDHPDLAPNLYSVGNIPNKLPGEVHGWDFANDDPDTRISPQELQIAVPLFQDMFRLSDADLLKKYDKVAKSIQTYYPDFSSTEVAGQIRSHSLSKIAREFHGTWSTGVIAARPAAPEGVVGVAPRVQFLPVRVFGLGGAFTSEALIEGISYAAARGVDVINMSLGSFLPGPEVEAIFDVLDQHPKLVIVASAGNETLDVVGFPAAVPGVLSVGASNLAGQRTFYSNFGARVDVVAPGGDTSDDQSGGILTTGGTFLEAFWQGISIPKSLWKPAADARGKYVSVQGTSFSAPAVAGVVALMKGEDPNRRLSRDRLIAILKQTASYQNLAISRSDTYRYRLQQSAGLGTYETRAGFQSIRPSGIFPLPTPISAQQYFFGVGLVNAEAAVQAVKQAR
ncbi:MAG: S8 family serine peptidase [Aphanocapsa sp. GSE-SYN-MK-11-07L]|jgi:subtilisin family serine protease|nr:S8 family serine peptidase [Aphanocapsa sp. GSE-SYN-MK-11-07L]